MTLGRQRRGRRGEALAAERLVGLGYRLLERNARARGWELDLVAEDGGVIVFVEVRSRATGAHGAAAESVTRDKQARLSRAALAYLAARGWLERPARFDVVAVDGPAGVERVEVIRDAFSPIVPEQAPPRRRW